ncbi:MAG TPA: sodium:proline symporter, partial [Bacteroidia bacterium]|nr:sodium:proline symporter [Bacteroidia bacterium]
ITLFIMVCGLLVSTQITRISDIWSFIIECGAGLGLVLILRWYWWRINAWSEIAATIAPFIGFAISRFVFEFEFPDSFFVTVGFTTLSWIVVTFATAPEKPEVLARFYARVQPPGWWEPVRKIENGKRQPMRYLVLCWISAVILAYSVLFGTGKLIFAEYSSAGIYYGLTIICIFALRIFMRKSYT